MIANARSFSAGGSLLQGSFTNRVRKPAEVMLVPMIDIFVVLVTFLLMTAVFSRVTILQLDLPSANEGAAPATPAFRLEVIVRESGFELTNGESLIAALPKVDGEYDLTTLAQLAQQLKSENPDVDDASVLLERTGSVRLPDPGDGRDSQRRASCRRGVCSRPPRGNEAYGAVHEHRRGRSAMSLFNRPSRPPPGSRAQSDPADRRDVGAGGVPAHLHGRRGERAEHQGHRGPALDAPRRRPSSRWW